MFKPKPILRSGCITVFLLCVFCVVCRVVRVREIVPELPVPVLEPVSDAGMDTLAFSILTLTTLILLSCSSVTKPAAAGTRVVTESYSRVSRK